MTSLRLALRLPIPGLLLGLTLVTVGCSGPTEDVRVTLCKDMARLLVESGQPVQWQGVERQMTRFEDQVITLRFKATGADGGATEHRATCHYAYDSDAEEYNTSSDPATYYATNPHRMTLDDRVITGRPLTEAIHQAMAEQGRDWLARLAAAIRGLFGGGG